MPHDHEGTALAVGDTVLIPCVVKEVHESAEYCNTVLETKYPLPKTDYPFMITCNSALTVRASDTDIEGAVVGLLRRLADQLEEAAARGGKPAEGSDDNIEDGDDATSPYAAPL